MLVRRIDENGYFIEDIILKNGEIIPNDCIAEPIPSDDQGNQLPFYKLKWNGTDWVEGATQEEIDAIQNGGTREKTEVEKLKEELELAQDAINFLVFKNM